MNARAQSILDELPRLRQLIEQRNSGSEMDSLISELFELMIDEAEEELKKGDTAGAMRAFLPLVREIAIRTNAPITYLFAYRLCMAEAQFLDYFGG